MLLDSTNSSDVSREERLRRIAMIESKYSKNGDNNVIVPSIAKRKSSEEDPTGTKRGRFEEQEEVFSDDMFADSDNDEKPLEKVVPMSLVTQQQQDNEDWQDASGYYLFKTGEVIDNKYVIQGQKGKGVFGSVAFAKHLGTPEHVVAIKILRRNETMRRAGNQEESLLKEIRAVPREKRKHVIDFLESFNHRQHLCLVFQSMEMNLRQVLYRFGRNVGINLQAVKRYGKHIFRALKCLRELGIVHADVKLDNILVSGDLQMAKLCDFGCAFHENDPRGENTTYLVSRFYRAPEIILGLSREHVGHPIDVWALATCIFELYAGKIMFPGRDNNDMLRLIMKTKGKLPNRLVKRHCTLSVKKEPQFESASGTFMFREICRERKPADGSQPRLKVRSVGTPEPNSTVLRMLQNCKSCSTQDKQVLPTLANLIESCLTLNPVNRTKVPEALAHPFFE